MVEHNDSSMSSFKRVNIWKHLASIALLFPNSLGKRRCGTDRYNCDLNILSPKGNCERSENCWKRTESCGPYPQRTRKVCGIPERTLAYGICPERLERTPRILFNVSPERVAKEAYKVWPHHSPETRLR